MKPGIQPMLALNAEEESIKFPCIVQPKLDGIRAMIIGGEPMSRSLKIIPNRNIQDFFKFNSSLLTGLDGELIVGAPYDKDVYRKTVSGVMSADSQAQFSYYVFDSWINIPGHTPTSYISRIQKLQAIKYPPAIVVMGYHIVNNYKELMKYHDDYTKMGYEGLIIRNGKDCPYKYGRSTKTEGLMFKMKSFHDSEAKIIGMVEQLENQNTKEVDNLGHTKRSSKKANMIPKGVMGSLLVEDIKTGQRFNLGTGFQDGERADMWKNPSLYTDYYVKYRCQPGSSYEKPRFPVFIGLRHKDDTSP